MSSFDDRMSTLQRQVAATPGKRVLVVEGSTDIDFLTWMFDKEPLRGQNLHTRWVIGDAGGKSAVQRMLHKKPKWVGLVDRDALSEAELHQDLQKLPNMFLLPRYCIENYLIDPMLTDQLIENPRYADKRDALQKAKAYIETQYDQGIRHGSLWRAVQPLQDALQERGFTGALLKYHLPDDEQVRQTLISWSDLLNWERVYADYEQAQQRALALGTGKALAVWVHGKMFWRNVVAPALGEALGESSADRLARRLFRGMDLPGDIAALLRRMMAYRYDSARRQI